MASHKPKLEPYITSLHKEAHKLDQAYNVVREKYFRGTADECELSYQYVLRMKAIQALHEEYLRNKAAQRMADIIPVSKKDDYLESIREAAINDLPRND